jgi:hypothetical protein
VQRRADIGLLQRVLGLGEVAAGDGEQLPQQPLVGGVVELFEVVLIHETPSGERVAYRHSPPPRWVASTGW